MNIEIEAKFYPVNKNKIRERLKDIGAKLIHPERKMRRSIADIMENTQLKCDYIRVRDEGDVVRMSAKIHARESGDISDQKEIDIITSDFDQSIELLKLAGIKVNRYQETLRETWEYKKAEIVIDTWPGLEPYVEIEADDEDGVRKIAEELRFDWSKKIITGIADVYMKVYGLSRNEVLDKISYITFDKNPFEGMTQSY